MNIAFRGQVRSATETISNFEYDIRRLKQCVCVAYETSVLLVDEDNYLDLDCSREEHKTTVKPDVVKA